MAAKESIEACERVLERDGWTITDDPLQLQWPGRTLQVDLGAERVIAAITRVRTHFIIRDLSGRSERWFESSSLRMRSQRGIILKS